MEEPLLVVLYTSGNEYVLTDLYSNLLKENFGGACKRISFILFISGAAYPDLYVLFW